MQANADRLVSKLWCKMSTPINFDLLSIGTYQAHVKGASGDACTAVKMS